MTMKPKTVQEKVMNILKTCGIAEYTVECMPNSPDLTVSTEHPLTEKVTDLIFENTPANVKVFYESKFHPEKAEEPQQEMKMADTTPEPEFDPTPPPAKEEPSPETPPAAKEDLKKEEPKPRLPTVMAYEQRYLQAKDLDGRYRLATAFFRSGMVPKGYKDSASVFAGMELALELGLKPFTALKNIAVINGSPAIWGDLPLALVRRSGKLERIQEFLFDKEYKQICFDNKNLNAEVFGALCRTWMTGETEPHETYFTEIDARQAGLIPGKADSAWFKYKRRMMQMRARTQNLKDQAGHVLLGIDVAEFDHNYMPMKDVGPVTVSREGNVERDTTAMLNKTLETH